MNELEKMVQEVPEDVEETAEEVVEIEEEAEKVYTEEEFRRQLKDGISRGVSRREGKIRKEYDEKYGRLERVLKAGTGLGSVDEIETNFRQFYEGRGVQIPDHPVYSDRDIAVLAKAEADEIIEAGYDEVADETDRLANIGFENMSARERAVFGRLAEYRKGAERKRELSKLGVPESVSGSDEFRAFAAKFNSNTSAREIYDIYNSTKQKRVIEAPRSMKSGKDDKEVKEFYTFEEAAAFTRKELDENPALLKALEASMLKW